MAREAIPRGRRWKLKPDSFWEYEEPVTRPDPYDQQGDFGGEPPADGEERGDDGQ